MKHVWISLGSNLGDRAEYLNRAIDLLDTNKIQVTRISPVYETAPQEFHDQNWFLNLVLEAETSLLPMQLLARCQRVERILKRQRKTPKGPRTIDLDIVFYDQAIIHSERLTIPHPHYHERRFVLQPMADLDPGLRDPQTHLTVAEMLAQLHGQEIRKTKLSLEYRRSPA